MPKLIFDIETIGEDFDEMDKTTQEALTYWIERTAKDEKEREALFRDTKNRLGFSPLTGEIVAIGVLDYEKDKGRVYFQAPGADLENKHIAALLALGIYTDTKALAGALQRDRNAFGYVTSFVSESEFYQLVHYPLPESHFKNLSVALNNFVREGSRVVLGTDITDPDTADDLSSIADYLLRMRDVSLVATWGVVEGTIRLSVRNNDRGFKLTNFLQDRFGTGGAKITPDGRGEGGALIELDIESLLMPETEDVVIALVKKWVKTKIFSNQPFSGKEEDVNGNTNAKPD